VLVDADGAWFGTLRPRACAAPWARATARWPGFLLADVAGGCPDERVRSGIRYGSAAAALPGTQAPTPPISSPATCRCGASPSENPP
jgi:1-phosphofructokinase